jgi:small-conductance mechanosensitive channel
MSTATSDEATASDEAPAAANGEDFSAAVDQAQRFWRTWLDFAAKAGTSAAPAFDPDADPQQVTRNFRKMTFDAMTQSTDQLMRSPQFLELMKGWLDLSIKTRRQMNDLLTDVHHGMQGVAREDVSSLQLSLRHVEDRTVELAEQLAARLDAVDRRLEQLEQAPSRPPTRDVPIEPGMDDLKSDEPQGGTGAGHVD